MKNSEFARINYGRAIKHRDNINGIEGIIIGYIIGSNKRIIIKMIEYAGTKGVDYAFFKRHIDNYKIIDEDKLNLKDDDIIYEMLIGDIELIEFDKNEIKTLINKLGL